MASKKSSGASKRPKKNLWAIPGLEKRSQDLIREGVLLKKTGAEDLCAVINEEFANQLAERKKKLSPFALRSRLDRLIWTAKVREDLWRAHGNKLVDKFRQSYSYIPPTEVDRKLRSLKGVTHSESIAQFKAGMGRLNTDDLPVGAEAYEFPRNSYKEPLVASTSAEGQAVIINGVLVGIKYPDIERNTLRRALADARKRKAEFVVLTNLTELWTKKTAGFLAVYRAAVSGIHINPDRFPADYQQEVRDILSGTITDKTIYQTLDERFAEILDGLHKISSRPNGRGPEFPGPVYIQLGTKEEELINAAAYYELRYMTIVETNKLQGELTMARNRLAEARKHRNKPDIKYWSAEFARLSSRKARAIITSHTASEYRRYQRRMRALVVRKLEAAIPNATVISQGTAHLKIGTKIVKTVIPSDDKVTDARLAEVAGAYGADVFNNVLADLTVVCPMYSTNFRDVGREDSVDGQPVTKFMAVAPSCLDAPFLREEFRDITKKEHPVQQLVFDASFKGGVLLLSWVNGILSADSLPIEKLDRDPASNYAFPYPRTDYITIFADTDNHFGGSAKRYIWDPEQGIHLGVTEAGQEMARRLGVVNASDLRVHCTAEMDDATNGDLWFKPRYRPDPQLISVMHMESVLRQYTIQIRRASERGDQKLVAKLADEISQFSMTQTYLRGDDFPFHQMVQVFERHLDPQVDFYGAVLERAIRSGLVLTPISTINRNLSDTRDLGFINFPEGNHRINTLEQADLEGDYMALHLRNRLAQQDAWKKRLEKDPELLRRMIRAPRFGNVTFGWGLIQAPGKYPWGLRVHAAPARQSGWSDILAAVIQSDLARGDDSYGLLKHVTVTLYGDRHFYARAETDRMHYVMCAAGVHNDTYGSSGGFPPNNTGICFVSLPADGPEAGPILVRRLTHDFLRDWFAKPTRFDWEKFLPNPV